MALSNKKHAAALLIALCDCAAIAIAQSTRLEQSLEIAEWTESRFAKFENGVSLTVDEHLEVQRLTARLASFDRKLFQAAASVSAKQLTQQPGAYRGKLVRIHGQAHSAGKSVHPEAANRGEGSAGFAQAVCKDNTGTFVVASRQLPSAWQKLDPLSEPMAATAIFVKLVSSDGDAQVPLLAAPAIEWYPTQANPPVVNYGMSVLGTLGMDVARLEHVQQQQPLERADTAAFYELLGSVQAVASDQLVQQAERHLRRHRERWEAIAQTSVGRRRALAEEVLRVADERTYSIAPFFNAPEEQVGELAMFDGVVRRAIRIDTSRDASAQALGVDHYYELSLFTSDSQNNALVFCVLDLPPEFALGEDLNESVRIAGFFFKKWRYSSRNPPSGATTEAESLRYAPLFVGHGPLKLVRPAARFRWDLVTGVVLVAVIAVVWLAQWRTARSDRAFARSTLDRIKQPAEPIEPD